MGEDVVDEVFSGAAWVAVYGAGYVGTALAAVMLRNGLKVILVDIDESKLRAVSNLELPKSAEPELRSALSEGLKRGSLKLTSNGAEASKASRVKIITAPVILDSLSREVDYGPLVSACEDVGEGLKEGDLVIIESSVPPGTTEEIVKPLLEKVSGLKAEDGFLLAYSPERIYVGRAVKDIEENYPKIVSGVGPKSLEAVAKFYSRIARKGVIKASSIKVAEFEKLAEGIYRDVNIALANQLALAAAALGIDYYEVVRLANTQPYSHLHLPGPGVGGSCVPVYPYFLIIKAVPKGVQLPLILTSRYVNDSMPRVVVSMLKKLLRQLGKDLKTVRKVAVLGDAFRGEVDDTRNSPTHDVVALLKKECVGEVVVHDPYVVKDKVLESLGVKLTNNLGEALEGAEAVLVLTRHKAYFGLRTSEIKELSKVDTLAVVDAVAYLIYDGGAEYVALGKSTP